MATRIPLACLACREKKRKCDGEKPRCGPCHRILVPCRYPEPPDRKKIAQAREAMRPRADTPTAPYVTYVSVATQANITEQHAQIDVPELPSQVVGQKLLETYFDKIHSANLLFHRTIASQLYAQNRVPEYLLQAIFAQAAILLRNAEYEGGVYDIFGKSWAWARSASKFVLAGADEPGIERVQALHVLHGYYFARGQLEKAEIHARLAFELCCVLGYDKLIDDNISFTLQFKTENFAREMKRRCFWACWSTAALRAEPSRSSMLCDMAATLPLPAALGDGGLIDGVEFELGPTIKDALSPGGKSLSRMAEIVLALRIWTQVQSFAWTPREVSDSVWELKLNDLKELIHGAVNYAQGDAENLEAATDEDSEDAELIVSIRSLHRLNRMLLLAAIIPAFSKHPAAAMVTQQDIWKSAEIVFDEANYIVQLFSSPLGRKLDTTRLWPLSGHAAFISGVVLLSYGGVIKTPFNASWIWNALRPDDASFLYLQEVLDLISQSWEPLRDQAYSLQQAANGQGPLATGNVDLFQHPWSTHNRAAYQKTGSTSDR